MHDARRLTQLEQQLLAERTKRLAAEQRAAGLASALRRAQATIARQKANEAERRVDQTSILVC